MVTGSRNLTVDQVTAQAVASPSPRELRAQAVQRLQVGLFGLALMLLLVSLANIIMQHARAGDAAQAVSQPGLSSNGNSDPLADIGVVPSPDGLARNGNGNSAVKRSGGGGARPSTR